MKGNLLTSGFNSYNTLSFCRAARSTNPPRWGPPPPLSPAAAPPSPRYAHGAGSVTPLHPSGVSGCVANVKEDGWFSSSASTTLRAPALSGHRRDQDGLALLSVCVFGLRGDGDIKKDPVVHLGHAHTDKRHFL